MIYFISFALLLSVVITGAVVIWILKRNLSDKVISTQKHIQKMVEDAGKQAADIIKNANIEAQKLLTKSRLEAEEEAKSRRQSFAQIESRLMQREKHLDTKEVSMTEKENRLELEFEKVKVLKKKEEAITTELSSKLESIAGLTKTEAEALLMSNVERESKARAGRLIKDIEDQAKKAANRRAREIITDAIQRTAVDHVSTATTTVVKLPDDEMKGRVIGREGRNIRAFEAATGVDIIIDDTPGAVILSSFDPIRREVARIALLKLLEDGRIHPSRIEELVEKARKELRETIIERGERAADEVRLQFHPKIIELLGKLHYRTSYGQNILAHSLEAAHVAGIMAAELGANVNLAKRGTLLHDIGKALDFEREGSHTILGKEVSEKYGESPEIINCIMAHHEEEEPQTIEAILVKIADAISSSRPGARQESVDNYIKRLEKLEALALSFEGVEKAYAIQAGREVRVIVKPDVMDDDHSKKLAFDMAKKIESELDYPGEIKVSVIRETRATGIAH